MSAPVGPYTPVVPVGDFLILSGQIGIDADKRLVAEDVGGQVRQAIGNVQRLLEGEGASLSDVVKATVFLTSMDDYDEMNEAYLESFAGHRPARTAVGVASLPLGARVEVECWARRP